MLNKRLCNHIFNMWFPAIAERQPEEWTNSSRPAVRREKQQSCKEKQQSHTRLLHQPISRQLSSIAVDTPEQQAMGTRAAALQASCTREAFPSRAASSMHSSSICIAMKCCETLNYWFAFLLNELLLICCCSCWIGFDGVLIEQCSRIRFDRWSSSDWATVV